jgi:aryl-alcohol dehydrogenase-like predicted oxidoreductase
MRLPPASLGLGTLKGTTSEIVSRALAGGLRVIDTAVHYRALEPIGRGMAASGVPREAVFVAVKGMLALEGDWEIDLARDGLALQRLDAFIVDQPERHVPLLGKEGMHRRLAACFGLLEKAVQEGRIGCYGIATFDALRVETDAALFQSLAALRALGGPGLRIVQLPFNYAMTEAFTRFSQATGSGAVVSTLQAAHELGFDVMASHTLAKGRLGERAREAMQFVRSTPGIACALVGISTPAHLEDLLAVAAMPPLKRAEYLKLYTRA